MKVSGPQGSKFELSSEKVNSLCARSISSHIIIPANGGQ